MNSMKTPKTNPPSSSSGKGKTLRLTLPSRWSEVTQQQLRYILTKLSQGYEGAVLKALMFLRFAHIKVLRRDKYGWKVQRFKEIYYITSEQVAVCTDVFAFVGSFEDMTIRLDHIGQFTAVPLHLDGVPFNDWLKMDIAYTSYLTAKDPKYLKRLARLLYRDADGKPADGIESEDYELLGCFIWMAHIKSYFYKLFPDFFRLAPEGSEPKDVDMRAATDAQLRLLTDGDVTKEEAVRLVDTKRALTELNAKAKEARELKSPH